MKMIAGSCLRAIANSRRMRAAPEAREHLHERRRRLREELRAGLVRDRLRQQRLARARRAVQQDPLRHLRAELLELLRVAQELDDLLQLRLAPRRRPRCPSNATAWLEAGLICCGLTRGITFSIRHITKMITREEQDRDDRLPVQRPVLQVPARTRCAPPAARHGRRRSCHVRRVQRGACMRERGVCRERACGDVVACAVAAGSPSRLPRQRSPSLVPCRRPLCTSFASCHAGLFVALMPIVLSQACVAPGL